MRIFAWLSIALWFVATPLPAADTPELTRLRDSYNSAIARVSLPLIQVHVAELEKLREVYSRATNLEGANKVQAHMDAILQSISSRSREPKAPAPTLFSAPAAVATPELDRLREAHKAAIEKAAKPLTQTYVKELEKLRNAYTRASKLQAANDVQSEIAAVNNPAGASPPAATPGTVQPPRSEWYIGKTWKSERGTQWTFAKGGTGEMVSGPKKTTTTWKLLPSGLIEVTGPAALSDNIGIWYMQIVSDTEGSYGLNPKGMDKPLHSQ